MLNDVEIFIVSSTHDAPAWPIRGLNRPVALSLPRTLMGKKSPLIIENNVVISNQIIGLNRPDNVLTLAVVMNQTNKRHKRNALASSPSIKIEWPSARLCFLLSIL